MVFLSKPLLDGARARAGTRALASLKLLVLADALDHGRASSLGTDLVAWLRHDLQRPRWRDSGGRDEDRLSRQGEGTSAGDPLSRVPFSGASRAPSFRPSSHSEKALEPADATEAPYCPICARSDRDVEARLRDLDRSGR